MPDTHVTISETIRIAAPPEAVWDFTQDYATRGLWDAAVETVEVLSTEPRRVRLRLRATGSATFEYVLDRRPIRTSLRMTDVESRWVAEGGGSWDYEPVAGGTAWTQTNTLVLRGPYRVFAPLVAWSLRRSVRQAMRRAKVLIERAERG
jgi:uncharacterized protein YndB with AHSA1/START domain